MKILIVTLFYAPNEPGGTETQTRTLAEELFKNGHEIEIISFDAKKASFSDKVNGITVNRIYLDFASYFNERLLKRQQIDKIKLIKALFSNKNKNELLNRLNKLDKISFIPDLINYCGSFPYFPIKVLFGFFSKKFTTAHKLLSIHDFNILGRSSTGQNKKIPIIHFLKKRAFNGNIDSFTVPSGFLKTKLLKGLKEPEGKVLILKNFLPEMEYKLTPNLINGTIKFLYAGSLEAGKGLDVLTNVFLKLFSEFENISLIIIGEGEYYDNLISSFEKYKNRVVILGKIKHKEVFDNMKKCNVVILPSKYNETFGLTLLEGYFNGALPIGSDNGALPELLNNNKNLIFSTEEELQQLLKRFILNKELIGIEYEKMQLHFNKYKTNEIITEFINFIDRKNGN